MNVAQFIAKWSKSELSERAAAQQHFLDLCELLEHPKPADVDPTGDTFTFERGVTKTVGGDGWADVWKKGFFGWEYKGKHKDLDAAYQQLLQYREALENPPLLVVCDMERFVVRTNFTNTPATHHEVWLRDLGAPRSLEILRAVFFDPEKLKPGRTSQAITEEAARHLAEIAQRLRDRGIDPTEVARFLDRLVFCLFAEDIELLPGNVFSRTVEKMRREPERLQKHLDDLFLSMAKGGEFLLEDIPCFNGNLFDGTKALLLTEPEIASIQRAAQLDWSAVEPAIFGTLFERGLDPSKRSQIGAHYTSREDIETLVEPVVMWPLRREWEETRRMAENLLTTGLKNPDRKSSRAGGPEKRREGSFTPTKKVVDEADTLVQRFLHRLRSVKILDPACGSANFLYVSLQKLKDLEKEVITWATDHGLGGLLPFVGPWQLFGIEVNPYAYELAQMAIWIGYLQWSRANGFGYPMDPILRPMVSNFQCKDAIIDLSDSENPREPEWPTVDFIVGNPPFLGDKIMRGGLGDDYVDRLRSLYGGRIPGQSDLCCYWFEKARAHITSGKCKRAGLLATQGIRGGANREVLKRIKDGGGIFWAESDRPWILDGANVHVSMVGFDDGEERNAILDGRQVSVINANLTAAADIGRASSLEDNLGIGFIGVAQKAPFDVTHFSALGMLDRPNPHGRPNSDVLVPIRNAKDLTQRVREVWNIDFGLDMPQRSASLYEAPFSHVTAVVRPLRVDHREARQAKYWWLFARPCPDMRKALAGLGRFAATPRVSKHRVVVWLPPEVLCDSALVVFARSDDLFFGIMHSRFHEVWALRMGTRLETRPRYTPSTCFETFPFPTGVIPEPQTLAPDSPLTEIASSARELNDLRENWLNPPEWTRTEILEFPGTVGGPWDRYIDPATVEERGTFKIGTVRYPRLVPRDADCAARLKQRTLTKLYNERPAWLANCHQRLDAAVAAAYGWSPDISDDEILERLLELNLERSAALPKHP
ncbi:class I SAM-dependent DNA methyltransferase [Candidatus Fermentibacteria bacterium]|nr:class I SAM-dependent DNA methyltransferase [Candidatus Fermentibacteria bacterium]